MPVSVPILEEDAIKLIIHSRVRRAQVHDHLFWRIRMYEELVDATCLDGNLAVFGSNSFLHTVNLNPHNATFNPKIFGLELVEMQWRTFGSCRTFDEFSQVLRDRTVYVVPVCLPKEKASSWRWFQELGR